MNETNISVAQQTVLELLASGQNVSFVIPEYQRPYAWGDDEIETLFEDLWKFSLTRSNSDDPKTYFLGSIVSYKNDSNTRDINDSNTRDIIDGQQRITSLILLLRAIFSRLEQEDISDEEMHAKRNNSIRRIGPAIWKYADRESGNVNKSETLIVSKVVSDNANETLRNILETGTTDPKSTDRYSRNYKLFLKLYDEHVKESPSQTYLFIQTILDNTILLSITAASQETALTIFSTLNDRGLPLADTDIFKAAIYGSIDDKTEQEGFIKKWQALDEIVRETKETIQRLFIYHMFYLRAREKDTDSTTLGLRPFFQEKGKGRLNGKTVDDIIANLNLWKVVNSREELEEETWSVNLDIKKILQCLSYYPNEFWKYPVVTFYNKWKGETDFETRFLRFLRRLIVMLLTRYLESPTVNSIKTHVLKLDAAICDSMSPEAFLPYPSEEELLKTEELKNRLITPHWKTVRMILAIHALGEEEQKELLPADWQIEHILPKNMDPKYNIPKEDKDAMPVYLEHLGNKMALESKLNIAARDGFFADKKEKYMKSRIALARRMGLHGPSQWGLNQIRERDEEVSTALIALFRKWVDEYGK